MGKQKKSSRRLVSIASKTARRTSSCLDELRYRHPKVKAVRKVARDARKLEQRLRTIRTAIEAALAEDEEANVKVYLELMDTIEQPQASGCQTHSTSWPFIELKPNLDQLEV